MDAVIVCRPPEAQRVDQQGGSSTTTLCAQIGGHGNSAEEIFGQHEDDLKLALSKSLVAYPGPKTLTSRSFLKR